MYNPLQNPCYRRYRKALRTGELVRPDRCEKCGKFCYPDGHREDYSKPLEVRWLCQSCHARLLKAPIWAREMRKPEVLRLSGYAQAAMLDYPSERDTREALKTAEEDKAKLVAT